MARTLAADLSHFVNNPLLSDITLHLASKIFRAHSVILCARSRVFAELLIRRGCSTDIDLNQLLGIGASPAAVTASEQALGEATPLGDPRITFRSSLWLCIHEPEEWCEALLACLTFMYTDTLPPELSPASLAPLAYLALNWAVPGLLAACTRRLPVVLNNRNSCLLWCIFDAVSTAASAEECRVFVARRFGTIFEQHPTHVCILSSQQLISLLQDDQLFLGSEGEDTVWHAVTKWAAAQVKMRSATSVIDALSLVAPFVKLPLLSEGNKKDVWQIGLPASLQQEAQAPSQDSPRPDLAAEITTAAAPGTPVWRRTPRSPTRSSPGSKPTSAPPLTSSPPAGHVTSTVVRTETVTTHTRRVTRSPAESPPKPADMECTLSPTAAAQTRQPCFRGTLWEQESPSLAPGRQSSSPLWRSTPVPANDNSVLQTPPASRVEIATQVQTESIPRPPPQPCCPAQPLAFGQLHPVLHLEPSTPPVRTEPEPLPSPVTLAPLPFAPRSSPSALVPATPVLQLVAQQHEAPTVRKEESQGDQTGVEDLGPLQFPATKIDHSCHSAENSPVRELHFTTVLEAQVETPQASPLAASLKSTSSPDTTDGSVRPVTPSLSPIAEPPSSPSGLSSMLIAATEMHPKIEECYAMQTALRFPSDRSSGGSWSEACAIRPISPVHSEEASTQARFYRTSGSPLGFPVRPLPNDLASPDLVQSYGTPNATETSFSDVPAKLYPDSLLIETDTTFSHEDATAQTGLQRNFSNGPREAIAQRDNRTVGEDVSLCDGSHLSVPFNASRQQPSPAASLVLSVCTSRATNSRITVPRSYARYTGKHFKTHTFSTLPAIGPNLRTPARAEHHRTRGASSPAMNGNGDSTLITPLDILFPPEIVLADSSIEHDYDGRHSVISSFSELPYRVPKRTRSPRPSPSPAPQAQGRQSPRPERRRQNQSRNSVSYETISIASGAE
eukprot:TRINITY_DN2354_c0_g1_i1.p1 TRINITY_DN2354_c0_g1~~TRINITY_DN2354_c0_g1_i1.p1  ORF type:complete len:956 (-),score=75.87 TRINITY_DN2354_c0_g1_i1:125-2992(-)